MWVEVQGLIDAGQWRKKRHGRRLLDGVDEGNSAWGCTRRKEMGEGKAKEGRPRERARGGVVVAVGWRNERCKVMVWAATHR